MVTFGGASEAGAVDAGAAENAKLQNTATAAAARRRFMGSPVVIKCERTFVQ
ncbi:MAG: hypothetical protein NVSMB64_20570 [Candidatus Velthaea sp.]